MTSSDKRMVALDKRLAPRFLALIIANLTAVGLWFLLEATVRVVPARTMFGTVQPEETHYNGFVIFLLIAVGITATVLTLVFFYTLFSKLDSYVAFKTRELQRR